MSEIRVTTLKDTSGGNSSSTADIYSGRAKAWVNFNGTSTVAIRAQFNVSSITDNGTGDYTVNFTTAMPDANYAAAGMGMNESNAQVILRSTVAATTSALRINAQAPNVGTGDPTVVSVAVFR